MRVLVVGAGAIGLLVGGELALGGHDVTFVARRTLGATLRQSGLHLTDASGARLIRSIGVVGTVAEAAALGEPFDWLLLAVKAYDVAGAADEISAAFPTPPVIVTFQNGLGSEEAVARVIGDDRLVSATITIPVTLPAPGQVEARRSGGIGVAPHGPTTDAPARAIADALVGVGFPTRYYADYRSMKWSKLLLNMIGNASSAILDMPPEEIFADRRLVGVELAAVREAVAVMRAWGVRAVRLPGQPVALLPPASRLPALVLQPVLRRLVWEGRGGKMPSLHMDLASGKGKSEVVYLNGAVVEWGRPKGVATPVNLLLTDTLMGLIEGRLEWARFRRQPEALLKLLAGLAPSPAEP